ncbi:MAG: 2-C-methyl-D-erythritol 4-phosphate cytidylyltransferase [Candidatus Rokuibacteriota bacterium]
MAEPRVALVIPAGGAGSRMGTRTPKQFLRIGRRSILEATLAHFQAPPLVHEIVIALPEAHIPRARRWLGRHQARRRPMPGLVVGGATRQESVWRALQANRDRDIDIVVVHDGVRPFITRDLVRRVVRAAVAHGAAICALPIAETVKRVRDEVVEATLDRSDLWAVQTPQAFRYPLLRDAHEKALRDGVVGTDEAMLVERLGHPVRVVRGLESNIKVTTPADLRRAQAWARR